MPREAVRRDRERVKHTQDHDLFEVARRGKKRLRVISRLRLDYERCTRQVTCRSVLPEGGEVMLFIGRLEQDNSKYRRQGVIDVLLGRDRDIEYYKGGGQFDPVDEVISGG